MHSNDICADDEALGKQAGSEFVTRRTVLHYLFFCKRKGYSCCNLTPTVVDRQTLVVTIERPLPTLCSPTWLKVMCLSLDGSSVTPPLSPHPLFTGW